MAVCERCGKKFNYEKRDGVCPACCFFNRPDGSSFYQDEDWVKKYRYEDSEYTLNPHSVEASAPAKDKLSRYILSKDENDVGASLRDAIERNRHKEVDGSHVHTEDGKVVKGSYAMKKMTEYKNKAEKAGKEQNVNVGKTMVGIWFFVVFILYFFFNLFLGW